MTMIIHRQSTDLFGLIHRFSRSVMNRTSFHNSQVNVRWKLRIVRFSGKLQSNNRQIYYQTAGIYYPAAWTGSRATNPLPICYRHRRICYKSSQPPTGSTDNLPISGQKLPGSDHQLIIKAFDVIVNLVICLHPGNRPITDRFFCSNDRYSFANDRSLVFPTCNTMMNAPMATATNTVLTTRVTTMTTTTRTTSISSNSSMNSSTTSTADGEMVRYQTAEERLFAH